MNKELEIKKSQVEINDDLLSAASLDGEESVAAAYNALKNGADLNAQVYPGGPNVLFLAATKDKVDLFEWLTEVTQKGKKIDVSYVMNDGMNFLSALSKENVTSYIFEKFIHSFDINVNEPDSQGYYPLFKSLIDNNKNQVDLFLNCGADPNLSIKNGRVTPLLFASAECFADIGIPLIKAGADVKAVDREGHNALMQAMLREPLTLPKSKRDGLVELIEYLIEKTDCEVNIDSASGVQPIFMAIGRKNYRNILNLLVEKGANVNAQYDMGYKSRGLETPLHYASKRGSIEEALFLLENGAKLSVKDGLGCSPESYLLLDDDMRDLFLDYISKNNVKFDVNALWGTHDKNDLFNANAIKKQTVFNILILESAFGEETLIDLSLAEDVFSSISRKSSIKNTLNLLIENGVKLTLKDDPELHSAEPMFSAISIGDINLSKLISNSADFDVNFKFNLGNEFIKDEKTYLSYLFKDSMENNLSKMRKDFKNQFQKIKRQNKSGKINKDGIKEEIAEQKELMEKNVNLELAKIRFDKIEILDLLLDKGADINQKITDDGKNAIFFIKEIFWLNELNKRGVDILPKDDNGFTPLDYAIINNNKVMINSYNDIGKGPEGKELYKLAFFDAYSKNVVDRTIQESTIKLGIAFSILSRDEYKEYNINHTDYVFKPNQFAKYVDQDGNSALIAASANNNNFLAKFAIQLGCDVNQKNNNGENALQYACANKMEDLAIKLLECGADYLTKNNEGLNALDFAQSNKLKLAIEKIEEMNKSKKSFRI